MSRVTYDAGNLTIEVDGLDTVAAALGDLKKKTPAAAKYFPYHLQQRYQLLLP